MRILRVFLPVLAALGFANIVSAQSITNVDANQEGKAIAITYDLKEKANIKVYTTTDKGVSKSLIPQAYLSGDVGKKVKPGKGKKVLWHVLDQYPDQDFQGENMSFIVKGSPVMRFFAIANAGYSTDAGFNMGLTIGQLGTMGWYLKGMTTLSTIPSSNYECDEKGIVDGVMPAYSGAYKKSMAFAVAGLTLYLGVPVYLNAGVGYGVKDTVWETLDGPWVKNLGRSYKGLAVDVGLIARVGRVALSVGVTMLGKGFDICAGIGYVF